MRARRRVMFARIPLLMPLMNCFGRLRRNRAASVSPGAYGSRCTAFRLADAPSALARNAIPRMSSGMLRIWPTLRARSAPYAACRSLRNSIRNPEPEDGDEEEAEQEPWRRSGFQPGVEPIQPHEDRSAGDRFVELCGMSRCTVDPVEDDGPGNIGGDSENLRVEEVPESDQQSAECDDNDHPIEQPQIRLIGVAPGVDEQRCQSADRGTVAGEPAFPHHQDLVRMAEEVPRIVEEAMAEARAGDNADQHVSQER